jgi:teichuronic acid biosynthesis glycosyltransferase TuaG
VSETTTWKNDLISVIMPAYNSSAFIADSIRSVLQQTYSKWELIVIDDCSSEPIKPIVQSFQDDRIRYTRLAKNSGVAIARNVGISKAKGRYIAFLDSDDIWLKNKLSEQLQFMETAHIGFSYTWYSQFKEEPSKPIRLVKTKKYVDYRRLLYGNDIGCLTIMLDRAQVQHIEMPVSHHEDYVTWLNILKTGIKAYSLAQELARYRISKDSLSGNKKRSINWTWKVYRESQKLPLLVASYYTVCYIFNGIKKHYL